MIQNSKEELVDADLEKMTRDELIIQLLRWREMAPMIKGMCEQLSDYRQISTTPGELQSKIDVLLSAYKNTIREQAEQIQEMRGCIDEMVDDPLQIDKRIDESTGRVTKKLLH